MSISNTSSSRRPRTRSTVCFKNGRSAWAHFQCHVEYPPGQPRDKKLQLTRHFLATTDRFSSASSALSGIFLNGCGATNFLSGQPDLQSSWSEHFMAECFVPTVIGPFCAVLDRKTLALSRAGILCCSRGGWVARLCWFLERTAQAPGRRRLHRPDLPLCRPGHPPGAARRLLEPIGLLRPGIALRRGLTVTGPAGVNPWRTALIFSI